MDAIAKLRRQARARRDAALAVARAEYSRAMRNIRALAPDDDDNDWSLVARRVVELIPSRPFSLYEMLVWLGEAEPDEPIRIGTVRNVIRRLASRGVLQRVAKNLDGMSLWAAIDCDEFPASLKALSLPDAIETVLGEVGPLRDTELTIALQDRGYRTYLTDRELYKSLQQALARFAPMFVCGPDGRWRLAD